MLWIASHALAKQGRSCTIFQLSKIWESALAVEIPPDREDLHAVYQEVGVVLRDLNLAENKGSGIRTMRRLRDKGLLGKQGGGNRTWYSLSNAQKRVAPPADLVSSASGYLPNAPQSAHENGPELATLLATLSPELATLHATLASRTSTKTLRSAIVRFCAWRALSVDELATLLGRKRDYLRNKHLIPMVREGALRFRYPESAKHPHQAYLPANHIDLTDDES